MNAGHTTTQQGAPMRTRDSHYVRPHVHHPRRVRGSFTVRSFADLASNDRSFVQAAADYAQSPVRRGRFAPRPAGGLAVEAAQRRDQQAALLALHGVLRAYTQALGALHRMTRSTSRRTSPHSPVRSSAPASFGALGCLRNATRHTHHARRDRRPAAESYGEGHRASRARLRRARRGP